ncbi:MAG: RES domain-containing protein [Gammaproteobacteria bacterium]|nr:RES domain-containing protein [Gammaproteobacteria bacterium]
MALVDTVAEQAVLERLVEASKPPVPREVARLGLHWLLFTPFRYPPPPGGSRFRGPNDPGVFYGAEQPRTACAEVGYWRWRHLMDTPGLESMPPRPQTVFRTPVAGAAIDLRVAPFERDRADWTSPSEYSACQAVGRVAREAGVQLLRYQSVRDSRKGGCAVVLDASAFAAKAPVEQQGWILTVTRTRVVWQRSDPLNPGVLEFSAAGW